MDILSTAYAVNFFVISRWYGTVTLERWLKKEVGRMAGGEEIEERRNQLDSL